MFKKLVKSLYAVPVLLATSGVAFAQIVSTDDTKSIGAATSTVLADIGTSVTWFYNLSFWLGGIITFLAILFGLVLMAWKAWSTDDEASKVAQTWFPKFILAGFAGVLIMTIPVIFNFITGSLGISGGLDTTQFDVNTFKKTR